MIEDRETLLRRKREVETLISLLNSERAKWNADLVRGRIDGRRHADLLDAQRPAKDEAIVEIARIEGVLRTIPAERTAKCGVCAKPFDFAVSLPQPPPTCGAIDCEIEWRRNCRW